MIKRYILICSLFLLLIIISFKNINNNSKIEVNSIIYDQHNSVNRDFTNNLGYLLIDRLNIDKDIKRGTSLHVLNSNSVGLYENGVELNDESGQIILAGHNNKYVFKNLFRIKQGDTIKIITYNKEYVYKVYKKVVVSFYDSSYFKVGDSDKEVILITCVNKDKRLLVFAK